MRLLLLAAVLLLLAAPRTFAQAEEDRVAVRRAATDYIEALCRVDSMRIVA